ncbi:tetratricopeptide repeat protein [Herbidospora sp. NEAU-GS84]|uniref:Tetratricopeptide repeat protein n=1 Tax=Herbidospora solisilvae TaxID=2696284 RepID=A0A7C9N5R9_9ACTN|nr:tetratricopeptide repeat protein [Herbidospora solisilvae]NAS25434.1 tetratricopeptide repeat protein [Herbidospora solisilvae]
MTGRDQPTLEPYVGLRAFRRQDSGKFFGRAREAHEVCDLWRSNQITVLSGPSGAGKTSLLNAGVMPLLDPSQNDILPVGRVSVTSSFPREALPEHNPHVYALLSSWSPGEHPSRLASLTLERFFKRRPPRQDRYGDPVLRLASIDQAEELFLGNHRRAPYHEWFLDQLVTALSKDPDLRVLISIRNDQAGAILRDERIIDVMTKGRFTLGALEPPAATQAIVGPLTGTGYSFDDAAAQRLIDDLSGDGTAPESKAIEPVQLQVVCTVLWDSLPPDVTHITTEHVIRYANVRRSLEKFVDQTIAEVARDHLDGDTARLRAWLLDNFVADSAKTPVYRGETMTAGIPNDVVAALVDHHILTPRPGVTGDDSQWYELSHESLVRLIRAEAGDVVVDRRTSQQPLHTAQHALREGDFARARRDARDALDRTDSSRLRAEIESFLGDVAFQDARYATAIDHYREAAALFDVHGRTEIVGRLLAASGRARRALGQTRRAIQDIKSAIQRVPDDQGVRIELAWTYWYGGHEDNALKTLDRVLDDDANSWPALRARAEILLHLDRTDEALLDFGRLGTIREPWVRAAHAYALARLGNLDEARNEITAVRANTAEHGPALLYAALVEQQAADLTGAADLAAAAMAAKAPPLPAHLHRLAERMADGQ